MKTFCSIPYDKEVETIYYRDKILYYFRPSKLRGYQAFITKPHYVKEAFTEFLPPKLDPNFIDYYNFSEERESLLNQLL